MRWHVRRIEVLKPIRWINLRRNEVASKVSDAQRRSGDGDGQRRPGACTSKTTASSAPACSCATWPTACMPTSTFAPTAMTREPPAKFFAHVRAPRRKGQCVNQPYLGCREFAARFPARDRARARAAADRRDRDLGWMLHDLDFTDPADPQPRLLPRRNAAHGVIDVPSARPTAEVRAMILQALVRYYDRKARDPDPARRLPSFGLEDKEIPFIIELLPDGQAASSCAIRGAWRRQEAARPAASCVPQGEKKTSGVTANLLWDSARVRHRPRRVRAKAKPRRGASMPLSRSASLHCPSCRARQTPALQRRAGCAGPRTTGRPCTRTRPWTEIGADQPRDDFRAARRHRAGVPAIRRASSRRWHSCRPPMRPRGLCLVDGEAAPDRAPAPVDQGRVGRADFRRQHRVVQPATRLRVLRQAERRARTRPSASAPHLPTPPR